MSKLQLTCLPEDKPDQSEVLMSRPSSAELQLTSNEALRPKAPNSINCVSAPAVFALIYLHDPTVPGWLDQTPEIVLTRGRPMFWGWELCVAHYCGPLSVMPYRVSQNEIPENSFQMLKKCQKSKIQKAKTEMIWSFLVFVVCLGHNLASVAIGLFFITRHYSA